MAHFGLLTLLLILCSLNQAAGEVYYITTNSTDVCAVQPCLTLSQFAANSSDYLHSNTTLIFLPGTHYLGTVDLTLSNMDNFVMKSENATAQIKCTNDSSMHLSQSQYIHITNLKFTGCGGNVVDEIEEIVVQDTKFEGQEKSGTALELIKTTAQIINGTFVSNGKGLYRECIILDPEYGCLPDGFIGGAIVATNSTVDISHSEFGDNGADVGGAIFAENHSIINMNNNMLVNNSATILGGVLYSNWSTITIEASEYHDNSAAKDGGVLFSISSDITLEASEFHNNSTTSQGGVLYSYSSNIIIEANKFYNNSATYWGGVLFSDSSDITIKASEFHDTFATFGGVLHFYSSNSTINASEFHDNCATTGGVLYSYSSNITVEATEFHDNSATWRGGVLESIICNTTIKASEFHDNSATYGGVLESSICNTTIEATEFHNNSAAFGGVLFSTSTSANIITIETSEFHGNSATYQGGVLTSVGSTIMIEASEFYDNSTTREGGVLYSDGSIITIGGSNFTRNASPVGAVIHAACRTKIQHEHNNLIIDDNLADGYAVIYLSDSEYVGYDSENEFTFSNNLGSLVAFNSNITFKSSARFVNNQPSQIASGNFQEGGAITLFQSNVFFDGACNLEHNHGENGGAIHSAESKLYVNGNITIAHNTATGNGGGVYLSTSELTCQQKSTFVLYNNTAMYKGGGLHAISSSIKATSTLTFLNHTNIITVEYSGTRIIFTGNAAERGGGLSLEANAKLYILKIKSIRTIYAYRYVYSNTTIFTANSADYGGAVYVDDDTNSGTCTSDKKTECFFQVLAVHATKSSLLETQSMYFSQNYANTSGSTLYGGLLDRCAVSQFAEVYNKYPRDHKDSGEGIAYFKNVSVPKYYTYNHSLEIEVDTNLSVSSDPVQICLCINADQNNSMHRSYIKQVKKGQMFTLSVVAVDQIGQSVSATIQTSLHFTESGLAEGQLARKIPAECTNLTFNIVSPHNFETLTLHPSDGPCKDADLSTTTVRVHFLPCSCLIGLQVSEIYTTNCTCECHSDVNRYMEHCDSHTGLLVKQHQSRAWISYINGTDLTGYLIYNNCPFDYCLSTSPPVDLNQPNGADVQCAFNRSSLLCGPCQPGLSLSLGSSHCLLCPSYWPALLIAITIAAILAGIGLVALLLVLNMTVADGTLNGLIIYANVVYANKSIVLPFQKTNFIISWLNLEIGIDTCYFPGMDAYIKTWLQLAFPAYVIILVIFVIIISSYSTKFSNLIGKKNPVATLATLILLSYAKFLEICFKSLSVGILEYPDGSNTVLWLPDATIKYLSGKHIPLFIAAVLILPVGLVYTALLFSWQWLLYLPRWRIFRWSRNPKMHTFIETYHTPYTPKHRYWTGLLLVVRIILYLVAAVNVSNNPTIALTAIIFTTCCLFALKQFFGGRLYRKWPVDILETVFYLNILSFATFTWYCLDNPANSNQEAVANTSVIITFVVLLLIILYHVYTYTTVFSKVKQIKLGRMIDRLFTDTDSKAKPERHWSPPPDDDIHRFNELLDVIDRPVNTYDYEVPVKQQKPVELTQSVVEVHEPCDLAALDPEEVANTKHIPGAARAVEDKMKEAVSQV